MFVANDHYYSDKLDAASNLCDFLELVMGTQGSPMYLTCNEVSAYDENAISDIINKKLNVMYGLTINEEYNGVTHISIDGIWYDLDQNDLISDDFEMAVDLVQSSIDCKRLVTRIVDNQPFSHIAWNNAKICNVDTVYKEYCYLIDESNWKDIATSTCTRIVTLASN